jgi:hypothetical protein
MEQSEKGTNLSAVGICLLGCGVLTLGTPFLAMGILMLSVIIQKWEN